MSIWKEIQRLVLSAVILWSLLSLYLKDWQLKDFFPYKSSLGYEMDCCVHFAGGKLGHRDHPSQPQQHLGGQLFLISGVKHCYVFRGLCTNDLLKVTRIILTSSLWTVPSFVRPLTSRPTRIPAAPSCLSNDCLQVVSQPFIWPLVTGQAFKDIVCIVVPSRVQDHCSSEAAVEVD